MIFQTLGRIHLRTGTRHRVSEVVVYSQKAQRLVASEFTGFYPKPVGALA
jgi:hypothetical protein